MRRSRFLLVMFATALSLAAGARGAMTELGYTVGSGLLGPTIVDGASHAGLGTTDLRANDTGNNAGPFPWVATWDSLWGVGDSVSLTGIAIPVRSPNTGTANNTSNGTWTLSVYELSGGANPDMWDGSSNGETVLATVDIEFDDAGAGGAIVPYATFDMPVDFIATSSGIALHLDSTGSLRTRWDDNADGVDGLNANRFNGGLNGRGHQWTVAGIVTPVPEPHGFVLIVVGVVGLWRWRRS